MEQIGGRIMPNNHFRPRTAKSLATPARICAFETLKLAMDKSLFVSQAFDRVMEGKNLFAFVERWYNGYRRRFR